MATSSKTHADVAPTKVCKRCKTVALTGKNTGCLKYLKNNTDIDNNQIICCETPQSDKCSSESDILQDASDIRNKNVDMKIFNCILNLKDIKELREKIDLLNKHIELITENNILRQNKPVSLSTQSQILVPIKIKVADKVVPDKTKQKSVWVQPEETPNTSKKANPPVNENKGNSPILKRNDVSAALPHEETSLELAEYIDLNKEIPRNSQTPDDPTSSSKFDWKQAVGRRNRKRRQMITGNNKETVSVKGVPKHVTLHVCRVDKATTVASLTALLNENFPEATFVKRVLSSSLTNEIALQNSWLGRKDKLNFSKLYLAKVIINAAEKADISHNITATERAIQIWLKRASDRKNSAINKKN
ncbi:hypothetical protein JTB14_008827 [Gonioctena quinquepunctata]|nr:hypothetical protein JTB14_008827 [Gonioctena quinquepunctata]